MMYYIKYKEGGTMELGEESFKVFWAGQGLTLLMNVVDKHPEKLEDFTIVDHKGKLYELDKFLDKISKLKVRKN